jgi:hypothetical protein
VRVHYPPIAGDHALTFFDGPGRSLFLRLREVAGSPTHFSIDLLVDALLYCAAPLWVAVFGALTLLRPRWLPSRRARLTILLLSLAGAVWSALTAAIFISFVGSLDVVRAERTLQPDAAVALLGYLLALLGSALLPARPRSSPLADCARQPAQ